MFEIIEKENEHGTIIKVFGVGGAGGNAIQHMIEEGVEDLAMPFRGVLQVVEALPYSRKVYIERGSFPGVIGIHTRLARDIGLFLSWVIPVKAAMEKYHRITKRRGEIVTGLFDIGAKLNQSSHCRCIGHFDGNFQWRFALC